MQKSAPSLARLLTMVVFALSCFGLLLFLWLSFGGPIPLKPKGYRVQVAFPEATHARRRGRRADRRRVGRQGRASSTSTATRNRTLATIELDREFAPLRADAQAMLRQKTLLGETYVELTPGTAGATLARGRPAGRRAGRRHRPARRDLRLARPATRASFRTWQQELAKGIAGRGRDFNDALGTLPGFAADGADVLRGARLAGRGALQRLVKNTGVDVRAR